MKDEGRKDFTKIAQYFTKISDPVRSHTMSIDASSAHPFCEMSYSISMQDFKSKKK